MNLVYFLVQVVGIFCMVVFGACAIYQWQLYKDSLEGDDDEV